MKRLLILLLAVVLCLSGCKENAQSDLPGGETVPEGIDWKLWEQYVPATLTLGQEQVDVLITLDAIHLAVYYDRDAQELLCSFPIPEPLSDIDYSLERLQIRDEDLDGCDDLGIPDMLENGDRTVNWWLWDPGEKTFVYAPEFGVYQEDIGGDISWQEGKDFISASMDTPGGPQDLLILVEGQEILVYLDQREEKIFGTAQIPEPLSEEALEHLSIYSYWDCVDISGDGWGDLQLPCRWEEGADGSVYQYAWYFLWDPVGERYVYDPVMSAEPVL